ncbi:4Fe-4S dicluster domain-containing protein [Candidatus Bathyarchaeota archaeon]|nr:4Fe-4S dicluster domain-containing protein [Candidatus Bathyarchaeota archaeon]
MAKSVDISLSLCGVPLSNPLILAAGPYSRDSETLRRAIKAGFGAVTTKTIRLIAAENPFPHMAQVDRDTLINAEKWSDLPSQIWVEHEIQEVKRLGVPVIASIDFTGEEVEKIASLVEDAGADFIEIVSYDVQHILPMLKATKSVVKIPVIAKVRANWQDLLKKVIKVERFGADAVSAIDSIGPVLAINVETGKPYLGSVRGEGWLSGAAIRTVAVRCITDIARKVKIPVIGIGGVFRGRDVVEMIMAGAQCVELCTAPIMHGLQVVNHIKHELIEFMERKRYKTLQDFRGIALKHIDKQKEEMKEKVYPKINMRRCTSCKLCANLCPYQALTMKNGKVILDKNNCLSCGLCYSICPQHAISLVRS